MAEGEDMKNSDQIITQDFLINSLFNQHSHPKIVADFGTFLEQNKGNQKYKVKSDLLSEIDESIEDSNVGLSLLNKLLQKSKDLEDDHCSFNLASKITVRYIDNGDLETAKNIAEENMNVHRDKGFHNNALDLLNRVNDLIYIRKELSKIDKKLQKERFKVIEILGFFIAVLAFIFGGVQILSSVDNINDSIKLMKHFSTTLLLFLSLIIVIFSDWKDEFRKSLVSLFFVIGIIICIYLISWKI